MNLGKRQIPVNSSIVTVGSGPTHQMGCCQRTFDYLVQFHSHRHVFKISLLTGGMNGPGHGVVRSGRRDHHRLQALASVIYRLNVFTRRPAPMDAHAVGNADGVTVLVGLDLTSNDKHQRTRTALFLKDVHHFELAGYPVSNVSGTQKLPVASTV